MSGVSPTGSGGPSPFTEYRVVVLGKTGAEKRIVAQAILNEKTLKEEPSQCDVYDIKEGKRITLVYTPGWGGKSVDFTTERIKKEIAASAALCPPGPYALILVLPLDRRDQPSAGELEAAKQHMELLSDRVWNHTVLVFVSKENEDENAMKSQMKNVEQLVEKCSGRFCLFHTEGSKSQINDLFRKIDDMMKANEGAVFIPSVSDELSQKEPLEQTTKEHEKEKQGLRHRRKSSDSPIRPNLSEETKEPTGQTKNTAPTQPKKQDEMLEVPVKYLKVAVVVLLSVIGALVGAVVAPHDSLGLGIITGFVFVLFSLGIIYTLCTRFF